MRNAWWICLLGFTVLLGLMSALPGTVRSAEPGFRDVTRLASFRVNDDSAVTIDPQGRAVLRRRAETDLIVRYQSQVVSTRLGTVINPSLKLDFAALRSQVNWEIVSSPRRPICFSASRF